MSTLASAGTSKRRAQTVPRIIGRDCRTITAISDALVSLGIQVLSSSSNDRLLKSRQTYLYTRCTSCFPPSMSLHAIWRKTVLGGMLVGCAGVTLQCGGGSSSTPNSEAGAAGNGTVGGSAA